MRVLILLAATITVSARQQTSKPILARGLMNMKASKSLITKKKKKVPIIYFTITIFKKLSDDKLLLVQSNVVLRCLSYNRISGSWSVFTSTHTHARSSCWSRTLDSVLHTQSPAPTQSPTPKKQDLLINV